MQQIAQFVERYNVEIILGILLAIIVLFILFLSLSIRITKVKGKYGKLVRGMDGTDIERILLENGYEIDKLKDSLLTMNNTVDDLYIKLDFAIQKVGFIRYNAFADISSEISFSIAFLDNYSNGFVLTSIYGREQSTCYAKPISKGKSVYPLSVEEMQALDRAVKGESLVKSI